jgi:IclR family acetate operon transcriptional repressor
MSDIDGLNDKQIDSIAGVERALFIIEQLADAPEGLSFTEILNLLAVNKSIAYKLINTLIGTRYIFKNEQTGQYCLTYKVSNLGLRKMTRSRLLNQSNVILRELADNTGELVRLAVVERDTITWVLSIQGRSRILQIDPNYSLEVGLHTHAAGKAWLSTVPAERAQGLILRKGLERMTRHSLVDIKKVMADLKRAAKQGYAISYEEHAPGVGAIGAPILVRQLDDQPQCVGTVTLAAPCAHMDRQALEACAPQLIATAAKLASVWPFAESGVTE